MGLIKFIDEIDINEDIYGFGKWKTEPVKFQLKPDTKPHSLATARHIALPRLKHVKEALTEMERNDVIEKVSTATPWVSPMVPVAKPNSNKVRICVDYKKLN